MIETQTKRDIRKSSLEELIEIFKELNEPKFRAKQVYEWLWKKGARSFEEMTNLSKKLRAILQEQFVINAIEMDKVQKSLDGTIKTRFRLHDGHLIESVLIPVPADKRFTVCVSSQVGCSLTCKFCATGRMKRLRNLDPGEIYDQVVMVNKQAEEHFNHPLTNIVYMGMGEPLLAYKNVLESVEKITSPEGLGMSPRRITVSTAGIAKMIKKLADDGVRFNLALSLHAADDSKRNEIMPINEQNNLEVLMDSLIYFHQNTNNKISYEYITFQDFNDSIEDAKNLVRLCKKFPVKVNIIEYNPIDGAAFKKSTEHRIDDFARYLNDNRVTVTVRRSRGKDIDAACGQLANKE
ncbi:MAG: 23S rRNA (adenine(2503)-C(2))-methyltransferase RlmN [Saprospiraceae bacterium]|nr:23S rRNA (adenine(2503)-C(2))-methyltransferase RlmN [Saprospiraceae bacterium]